MTDEITITMPPARKFLDNSIKSQAGHIREESGEVLMAVIQNDEDAALEETLDCIQSCVTMLSIFKKKGFDIEAAATKMFLKNERRGYYER